MTPPPSVPGETPALDAMLRHVEEWTGDPDPPTYMATEAAPRLAAIVRVAVRIVNGIAPAVGGVSCCPQHDEACAKLSADAVAALSRIERIAAGEQGEA